MKAMQAGLAMFLSALLCAGPGLAQSDMPDGDFDMPDGDFEEPADDAEDIDADAAGGGAGADDDTAPGSDDDNDLTDGDEADPVDDILDDVEPDPTPLQGGEPAGGTRVIVPPSGGEDAASSPPRRRMIDGEGSSDVVRTPVGAVDQDAVLVPPDEPPAGPHGSDSVVWIATGVGTAVGVAILAGLGVGGFYLLNPPPPPSGSITITPR